MIKIIHNYIWTNFEASKMFRLYTALLTAFIANIPFWMTVHHRCTWWSSLMSFVWIFVVALFAAIVTTPPVEEIVYDSDGNRNYNK